MRATQRTFHTPVGKPRILSAGVNFLKEVTMKELTAFKKADDIKQRFINLGLSERQAIQSGLVAAELILSIGITWATEDCVKQNPLIFESDSTIEYWEKIRAIFVIESGILKSYYRGVYNHGNSYQARIKSKGIKLTIGTFTNKNEAAIAYNNAAIKLHGKKAKLNIIIK